MKYTEEVLQSWTTPLSNTEKEKVTNTERMIRDAINSSDNLKALDIQIFAQGSYANNTNVRQNSDIDICIMLKSTFYSEYVDGLTDADYGFSAGTISYNTYKSYVISALENKFGKGSISIGNKSIQINSNSYRVNADVIPAMLYRNFKAIGSRNSENFIEGIKYFAKDGTEVVNYPKVHIENGKQKNNNTNRDYKKLVRIMKRIRNNMVEDKNADKDKITSFLVECLVWNLPNSIINENTTWEKVLRAAIYYLWNNIKEQQHQKWTEVSGRFYLFHSGRKWNSQETQQFLKDMWNYLELGD